MDVSLPTGYCWRKGSLRDKALLTKFMCLTYQELFPEQQQFSHLEDTVRRYFSTNTPLWWVEQSELGTVKALNVAYLWAGAAIDQVTGEKYTHIFSLYVRPQHRHKGIGTALIKQVEHWAKAQGDRQIGLQVFERNQAALGLYRNLSFQAQSRSMIKPLKTGENVKDTIP